MADSLMTTLDIGLFQKSASTSNLRRLSSLLERISRDPFEERYDAGFHARAIRSLFLAADQDGIDVSSFLPAGRSLEEDLASVSVALDGADAVFHHSKLSDGAFNRSRYGDAYLRGLNLMMDEAGKPVHLFEERDKLKISTVIADTGLPVPDSSRSPDFFIPYVMKRRQGNTGTGVFLIERVSQVEDFLSRCCHMHFSPYKKGLEGFFFQEYIETPSSRYTHYRVITVGTGIIASVLMVSHDEKEEKRQKAGFLGHPAGRNICSNAGQGGFQIPLSHPKKEYSPLASGILEEHGIDPKKAALPEKIERYALAAAGKLLRHGYVMAGQDWIQDRSGSPYFLEANGMFGYKAFNTLHFDGLAKPEVYVPFADSEIARALKRAAF